MAPAKKAKTLKKKAAPSARKKSAGKGAVSARKTSAKKPSRTAKGTPAKKKVTLKKAVVSRPVVKKVVKKKIGKKAEKTAGRLEELRKTLINKREAIVREAKEEISKYVSGENRQLVDTALDEGDWAVVDISEDLNLMRLGAHRKALHDIDESLRKIKEGTYGICEECGEQISEKRLSVIPTATLCINCQETKEQLEAFEKEGTL
jgi:RNA polymerase-binding transcription factor